MYHSFSISIISLLSPFINSFMRAYFLIPILSHTLYPCMDDKRERPELHGVSLVNEVAFDPRLGERLMQRMEAD